MVVASNRKASKVINLKIYILENIEFIKDNIPVLYKDGNIMYKSDSYLVKGYT